MQELHFAFSKRKVSVCLDTAVGVLKKTFPNFVDIKIVDLNLASDLEIRGNFTKEQFHQICAICKAHDGYIYSF